MSRNAKGRDTEKGKRWRGIIREAAGSGMSIRAFCRRRRLKESQFYWWQRNLKRRQEQRTLSRGGKRGSGELPASFALVSEEAGAMEAGIELVLGNGCRVRIGHGVDEQTLRTVLAAVERDGC